MKKLKYLLSIVLLLIAFSAFSQVEIIKSTEKVRIGDKVYYIHLVKQGETIYSLCRVYNVSQEELLAANPELTKGLKAAQRLKIPEKPEKNTQIVQPVQTPAKIDEKAEQNTAIVETAPTPAKIDENTANEDIDEKENSYIAQSAIKHKVKSGDKLESVAKKYNCSVDDILRYNAFLDRNSKLKKGQYLTIFPNTNNQNKTEIIEEKPLQKDTLIFAYEFDEIVDCSEKPDPDETFNLVLLLPIKAFDINKSQTKSSSVYDFIEFYEGFLLAIDSLSRKNISINLSTFDVYDTKTLNDALQSQTFANAQLVISHTLTRNDLDEIVKAAAEYKIPVVSPFYSDLENITAKNKYFIQTTTPMSYQNEKISRILCDVKENVIVVYEKITDTANYKNFINTLKNCGKNVKTYNYILTRSNNEELRNIFDGKEQNNVFVVSNNQVFVVDVLSKLNKFSIESKFDITVYGSSYWKSFENYFNFDHVHNLNLSMLQQNFIDYNRNEVKDFISKCRYYYKGDPSRFSFQGFDLGIYFIEKLAKYGKNLIPCITNDEAETLLQTRLKFSKISDDGGLVNTESLLLHHTKDFNIVVE